MRLLEARTSVCTALSTERDGDCGTAVGGPGARGQLEDDLVAQRAREAPTLHIETWSCRVSGAAPRPLLGAQHLPVEMLFL